ncbi:MAG: hypothetical protein M1818_000506 [Claussenomyces sp. TS43310]|nr:MAG: hypothetical protein M1818_000506 [Claussenomyces sp. TS43310]
MSTQYTALRDWHESSSTAFKVVVLVSILFLLGNVKGLFGAWHYRIFRALLDHLVLERKRHVDIGSAGPQVLFQPVISASRSPLLECDFNGHKSNSTFYADLDISRVHLLCILFKDVLSAPDKRRPAEQTLGKLNMALGGVSCTFRKEIKPYEKYEIWSRVLTWDNKWIYIASHFVRGTSVKPRGYTLRPSGKASEDAETSTEFPFSVSIEEMQKVVIASAISRYVFKRGHKSIPPQQVLQTLGFIPPPSDIADHATPAGEDLNAACPKASDTAPHRSRDGATSTEATSRAAEGHWDGRRVEHERQRGLDVAQHFTELDGLHTFLSGSSMPALGRF